MKKRVTTKKRANRVTRTRHKKLHHRIISFFKGDGGIYTIFVLASVMAGAFALTGGVIPSLNPKPSAADQVSIDPDSAKRSSESALQLVDIKVKPTDTPVPSPTSTPATTPPTTPTPAVQACLDKTIITLLIDLSSSMSQNQKAGALQDALGDFTTALYKSNGKTVVSAIGFGAGPAFSYNGTAGVTLIMGYTSNKDLVYQRLSSVSPGIDGGTYTRDAFSTAISRITDYQGSHPKKDNNYVSILFTDGVPENVEWIDSDCYKSVFAASGNVCWSKLRDPRATPYSRYSTDLTTKLKGLNNKVYSIGIYNSTPGTRGSGLTTDLQTLLQTIASKSTSPYYQSIDLRNGDPKDLTKLFSSVLKDVCATN